MFAGCDVMRVWAAMKSAAGNLAAALLSLWRGNSAHDIKIEHIVLLRPCVCVCVFAFLAIGKGRGTSKNKLTHLALTNYFLSFIYPCTRGRGCSLQPFPYGVKEVYSSPYYQMFYDRSTCVCVCMGVRAQQFNSRR